MTETKLTMPDPYFITADRPSLPETVYVQLRQAIHNGVLKPGEVLRQEDLARKLGVSRAPLREALPRLEADGMIILRPRRGYSVVELDPEEIEDIFDMRATVEEKAVRAATARRRPEDVQKVRSILQKMQSITVSDEAERRQWFDLNFQFHDALAEASGRKHLARLVFNLRSLVEPYIRVEVLMTGDVEQADLEHARLALAFEQGHVELAGSLIRVHIQSTANRLLNGLKASKDIG
jgi:DNA-binding GntR family transcriptional regulator